MPEIFGDCRAKGKRRADGLALARLHARVLLVDDIDPSMPTYHAAILVARFGGA
jgi:hypothetical protein